MSGNGEIKDTLVMYVFDLKVEKNEQPAAF